MKRKPSGEEVGRRIEIALDFRNATRKQAGAYAGVSGQAVSQWISGDTKNFGAVNAWLVCEGLKVSLEWVLFNEGPMALEEIESSHAPRHVINEPQSTYNPNQDVIAEISKLGAENPQKLAGLRLFLGLPVTAALSAPSNTSEEIKSYFESHAEMAEDAGAQTNVKPVNITQAAAPVDKSKNKNDAD